MRRPGPPRRNLSPLSGVASSMTSASHVAIELVEAIKASSCPPKTQVIASERSDGFLDVPRYELDHEWINTHPAY
jgi:hypothetical protein